MKKLSHPTTHVSHTFSTASRSVLLLVGDEPFLEIPRLPWSTNGMQHGAIWNMPYVEAIVAGMMDPASSGIVTSIADSVPAMLCWKRGLIPPISVCSASSAHFIFPLHHYLRSITRQTCRAERRFISWPWASIKISKSSCPPSPAPQTPPPPPRTTERFHVMTASLALWGHGQRRNLERSLHTLSCMMTLSLCLMRREHLGLPMKYPRSCALLHHERLNDTTGCLEDKRMNENNRSSFSHCSV